jgi:hypothetical protein
MLAFVGVVRISAISTGWYNFIAITLHLPVTLLLSPIDFLLVVSSIIFCLDLVGV